MLCCCYFQDILLSKIDKVTLQHEEACKIKEVNDKRGEVVSKILESCLEEEEFADFQYYIDMKTQLALMHAEIRDKVKMGEERLNTLTSTKIDWSIFSLTWVALGLSSVKDVLSKCTEDAKSVALEATEGYRTVTMSDPRNLQSNKYFD